MSSVPRSSKGGLSRLRVLSPRNIGALYVLVALIVVFSAISPSEFANLGTAKIVLNEYSVIGLIALALSLPLASGLYDLSVGSVAGLAGITSAYMLANVSTNVALAVVVGLGVAVGAGLVNCVAVILLGIDSFIATLASGSIFVAITTAISGDNSIVTNVNGAFQRNIALINLGGVTLPVFVALAVAVILYLALERTGFGRRTYAIGFDQEVARLGGVRVAAIRIVALIVSSVLAGAGGIVATAQIGAGTPQTGPNYLLPAFAAAFLGATQFRPGRINAWGTIAAVLLLGTGEVGLLTVGGPVWAPDVFSGVVLITAVGLTSAHLTILPARLRRRGIRRPARGGESDDGLPDSADGTAPAVPASGSPAQA